MQDNSNSLNSFRLFHLQEKFCTGERRPKPRSGHSIVHYKGKIYSFGGSNPAIHPEDFEIWPCFKELWELNLTTGKWTKCEMNGDLPDQLVGHTAVWHPLDSGVMLLYGGTVPASLTTSNTVVSCHIETKEFKKLVTKEGEGQPMSLSCQAVVTDNEGLFYTVGRTKRSQLLMNVNMLDLRSSPPMWTSLYRLSGVIDKQGPRCGYSDVTNFIATLKFPLTIPSQVSY